MPPSASEEMVMQGWRKSIPAQIGAAILVPDLSVTAPVASYQFVEVNESHCFDAGFPSEQAALTVYPGHTTSGLMRRSTWVGPFELNGASRT